MNLRAACCKHVGLSLCAALVGVAGAPDAAGASGAPAAGTDRVVELRIVARKVEGGTRTVQALPGERIVLQVRADEEMTIHVHGYEISQRVSPGATARLVFVAGPIGRFPVTAHLPESGGAHRREPTLLYIEVHPR